MGAKLGIKCKLYYCTAGIGGTPQWVLAENIRDVTLALEKEEVDATTRANAGWKALLAGLKEGSIEFEMIWDTSKPAFKAFQESWFQDSIIGVAVMDGDILAPGSEGLMADCQTFTFSREEPLNEPVKAKVSIKPTYSDNAPRWHTVPASPG